MAGDAHVRDGLISALLCVVCGVGAVVRVRDQQFCARCAVEYQLARQLESDQEIQMVADRPAGPSA